MRRLILPILLLTTAAAFAQKHPATSTATETSAPATTTVVEPDSRETREEFKQVLQRTPPDVGLILKLDPTLFGNQQFMNNYPALAAFVAQHPEVAHNPDFYLDSVWLPGQRQPSTQSERMWEDTMQGLFVLAVMSLVTLVLTWVIRTLIEQRRWNRLSRVQTEVHTKLLDRIGSNEELLRYIETPAGRRFLESAPIPVDSPRQVSAPLGRILFSIQAGLVVAAAGIGLQVVGSRAGTAAQPLQAMGIVALSVGIGFVISAIVSFILSRRLRLLETPGTPGV